jgi:hypothetical protein
MKFQVGFSMNCPMRPGLSNTTCPQWLWEQNPVKVVSCPLRLRTSHSSSRKSPLFLLVVGVNMSWWHMMAYGLTKLWTNYFRVAKNSISLWYIPYTHFKMKGACTYRAQPWNIIMLYCHFLSWSMMSLVWVLFILVQYYPIWSKFACYKHKITAIIGIIVSNSAICLNLTNTVFMNEIWMSIGNPAMEMANKQAFYLRYDLEDWIIVSCWVHQIRLGKLG